MQHEDSQLLTFDLNTGTFKPYHKPGNEINYVNVHSNHPPNVHKPGNEINYVNVHSNHPPNVHKPGNEINYVNVHSNHPPNVIKQIPLSIQKRLSNLSSNEEIFKQATPYYTAALQRSGYDHKFEYKPNTRNQRRNNRKRNIIWFNPPYNNNIATNIGRYFLNLIKKHFPRQHKFHKIFNKNNVKISYSCMPNMKSVINGHNTNIPTKNYKDIKDQILLTNPVPSNIRVVQELDGYMKQLLVDHNKTSSLHMERVLRATQERCFQSFGPLTRLWALTEDEMVLVEQQDDDTVAHFTHISNLFEQTVLLSAHNIHKLVYQRRHNVLNTLIENDSKVNELLRDHAVAMNEPSNNFLFGDKFEEVLSKIPPLSKSCQESSLA